MKRFLVTCAAVLTVAASLHADVTIKQSISMAGGAAAMTGGMQMPVLTMRIKGMKARTDIDVMGQTMTTIVDLTGKQMYVLNGADKTAKLVDLSAAQAPAAAALAGAPKMEGKFEATGKSQTIDGLNCDEYLFAMTIDLAETMGGRGAQMPPEAAEAMKGVKMVMNGSIWMTKTGPGVAEYVAFQKAVADSPMASAIASSMGGSNGMDKVIGAVAKAQGMAYLTEINMTMEGTGQMVEMMNQMGAMKVTNKVTDVSTASIAEDLFTVPADYKISKQ